MLSRDDLAVLIGAPVLFETDELDALARYAHDKAVIVEIGTGHGASAVVLGMAAKHGGIVVTVDPFVQGQGEGSTVSQAEQTAANIRRGVEGGQVRAIIVQKRLTSATLAAMWGTHQIDVLFVDGDHRYEAVRADVDMWLPHMQSGGYIILHDSREPEQYSEFGKGIPGPVRVAGELANDDRVRLVNAVHSMTIWEVL